MLVGGDLAHYWVYLVGPIVGAMIAVGFECDPSRAADQGRRRGRAGHPQRAGPVRALRRARGTGRGAPASGVARRAACAAGRRVRRRARRAGGLDRLAAALDARVEAPRPGAHGAQRRRHRGAGREFDDAVEQGDVVRLARDGLAGGDAAQAAHDVGGELAPVRGADDEHGSLAAELLGDLPGHGGVRVEQVAVPLCTSPMVLQAGVVVDPGAASMLVSCARVASSTSKRPVSLSSFIQPRMTRRVAARGRTAAAPGWTR